MRDNPSVISILSPLVPFAAEKLKILPPPRRVSNTSQHQLVQDLQSNRSLGAPETTDSRASWWLSLGSATGNSLRTCWIREPSIFRKPYWTPKLDQRLLNGPLLVPAFPALWDCSVCVHQTWQWKSVHQYYFYEIYHIVPWIFSWNQLPISRVGLRETAVHNVHNVHNWAY